MKLLKLIDAVCIAGSNKNEDSIGYGDDFIFVIDGATGLRGVNIMGMRSDAEWFSKRLAEQLQIYLRNDAWSIQEILYMSLKQIREEYFAVLQNIQTGDCIKGASKSIKHLQGREFLEGSFVHWKSVFRSVRRRTGRVLFSGRTDA